ncbi:MAG: TRAP transporter large permease [Alphaproteobacteria bacterium]|nr:TRAP transporter large permease [Alphaproteobacteria bacterium]
MPEWAVALLTGMSFLFVFAAIGLPIAFSLFLSAFLCITWFGDINLALVGMKVVLFGSVYDGALLPLPLFILMASIFVACGASARAYDAFARLFGGFRAGLPVATNWLLAFLGALMGSSSAAVTMVTQMGAPELKSRGYGKTLISGVIVGGSGLAVVIPPSILMIVYAIVMEQPVIPLFAAGLIPGLMMAAGYMVWIVFHVRWKPPRDVEAAAAPAVSPRDLASSQSADARPRFSEAAMAAMRGNITLGQRLDAAAELLPLLAVVVVMLGSMFLGLASITEGAAVGVLGALAVGLGYRSLPPRRLLWSLWNAARITGFIMLLLVAGRYFGMYFSLTGISQEFIVWIQNLPFDGLGLLLAIMVVFLFLGCVMETISMMLVLVPIAAAALMAKGFDPVVLGVLFVINMEMSLTTPPIGGNLFVMAGMTRPYGITFEDIVRGAIPFLVVDAIVIVLVAQFPILATGLADLVR